MLPLMPSVVGGVDEAEEIGAVGAGALEAEAAVKLVPVAKRLIQPRLQGIGVGVVQHLGLVVIARAAREVRCG